MARNTDMMIDGGGLQSFRSSEAADKLATDIVATLSNPSVPEDIFKNTLNALRTTSGITPENINGLGQPTVTTTSAVTAAPVVSSNKPDPTKTAYTDLTAAQRAAMTSTEKTDYLQAAREATAVANAIARAAADPMKDPTQRPTAPPPSAIPGENYIYYYSWIGGGTTGNWELYRAPNTVENQMVYGSRAVGGETQASFGSSSGVNALKIQPQPIKDKDGNIIGWNTTASTTGPTTTTTTTNPTTTTTTNPTTTTTTTTNPNTTVFSGTGFNTTGLTTEQIDAVAGIKAFLSSLGIGDLSDAITNAIKRGYTTDTIKLIMQDPNSKDPLAVAFQKRFPANKERIAAGKPAIDAADYLRAERAYAQIFQSYGLSNLATNDLMSSFIAGDVSATEVTDRIALAVNRVQNADANTKAILKRNYPELTTGDIVGAMLNPKDGLPALQRKVQIAEIGGAALAQKLDTSLAGGTKASDLFGNVTTGSMGLEELASLGITKEEAQKGYGQVASIAPRSEFLSSITGGQDYTRLQAEQEVFGGLASAKRAREQLSETEVGRFSGKAGNIGSKSFGQSRTI